MDKISQNAQNNIIQKIILPTMKSRKVTAYKLAALSGVSEATISRWLNGKQNLTLVNFVSICRVLELKVIIQG